MSSSDARNVLTLHGKPAAALNKPLPSRELGTFYECEPSDEFFGARRELLDLFR